MEDTRERQCAMCWMQMPKQEFGKKQWRLLEPVCLACAAAAREAEYFEWQAHNRRTTRTCTVCEEDKAMEGFGRRQWKQADPRCLTCAEQERDIDYAIGEEQDIQYHTLLN